MKKYLTQLEGQLLQLIYQIDKELEKYPLNPMETLQQPYHYLDPYANRLEDIQLEIQQVWIHAGRLLNRYAHET